MAIYSNKRELVETIRETSRLFIDEFASISEADKDTRIQGVDRTPAEMIAYQLGWLSLIMEWDSKELAGEDFSMPTSDIKWNDLGQLYQQFYHQYKDISMHDLVSQFSQAVEVWVEWVESFSEEELRESQTRKWSSSLPSQWPIWKWIRINSVSPFTSFRSQIRKWKKYQCLDGNTR